MVSVMALHVKIIYIFEKEIMVNATNFFSDRCLAVPLTLDKCFSSLLKSSW